MLETAVDNGTQELGLQQEVTETGRVHTDIGTLLVLGLLGSIGLGGSGGGVDGLDNIIILIVVNEIVVVVGHGLNMGCGGLDHRIDWTGDKLDPGSKRPENATRAGPREVEGRVGKVSFSIGS